MAAWWWLHLCIIPHRLTLWKVNVSAKKNMFAVLFLPSGATNGGCVWGGVSWRRGWSSGQSYWPSDWLPLARQLCVGYNFNKCEHKREKDTLEWVETLICYSCVYNFWFCCTPPLFCFWCSTPIFWPLWKQFWRHYWSCHKNESYSKKESYNDMK